MSSTAGDALPIRTHVGLAKEMKQKGVVLVVNGKPAILYPEAALVNEAGRILTSKIGLEDNLKLSFLESRGFPVAFGNGGRDHPHSGDSDDSVSLILDEGMAFTVDLPDRAWGANPMNQVELSWKRIRALNVKTIYPGSGAVGKLELYEGFDI